MAEGYPSLYRHDIDPMVGSTWDQDKPFNNLILEKWLESGKSEPDVDHPIVAGCTTIAMAQVMYYWKHPQRGTGTTKWRVGNEKYDVDFETPIDWEKTGREDVTALIELKITPQRDLGFDRVAERIYNYPEVQSLYLMSGGFDLCVVIEGRTMREVALFVAEKLAPMESVISTATHFVLRKYKDKGLIMKRGDVDIRSELSDGLQ